MENHIATIVVGGILLATFVGFIVWCLRLMVFDPDTAKKWIQVPPAQQSGEHDDASVIDAPAPHPPTPYTAQLPEYIEKVLGDARDVGEETVPVGGVFNYSVALLPPNTLCSPAEFMRMLAQQAQYYGLRHVRTDEYTLSFTRLS